MEINNNQCAKPTNCYHIEVAPLHLQSSEATSQAAAAATESTPENPSLHQNQPKKSGKKSFLIQKKEHFTITRLSLKNHEKKTGDKSLPNQKTLHQYKIKLNLRSSKNRPQFKPRSLSITQSEGTKLSEMSSKFLCQKLYSTIESFPFASTSFMFVSQCHPEL